MERRTVLLISYYFPPSPAVGGARIANFAKYLPEFGWEPVVLTISNRDLAARDDSRLERLPGVTVVNANCWPTLADAYLAGKRLLVGETAKPYRRPTVAAGSPGASGGGVETRGMALRRWILSLLSVPDGQRGWIVPAVAKALREIRRRRVACVVTSCPPYSVHVIGLLVALLTGVRWIADFRDPWMSGGAKVLYMNSRLSRWIDRWLERRVVGRADVVVANTPALCASLRGAYPRSPAAKFVTVTNSIDLGRFAALWTLPKDAVFTITYAGSLYFNRSPEPVFAAVRRLLDEGAVARHAIRIRLIGQCDEVGGVPTSDLVRRHGLEAVVETSPPIPYAAALEAVRRSHVALLLAPTQPNQIPAKAFDYIGVGTEILAIAGPGATADLVTRARVGAVYDQGDIPGITAFLRSAIARSGPGTNGMPAGATLFDARVHAGRLADLLEGRTVSHPACEVVAP